jgi:hypothetical protein
MIDISLNVALNASVGMIWFFSRNNTYICSSVNNDR